MQSDSNILKIDNLSKYFGGLAAVSNCSLNIKKGSITGIIGPNGSGMFVVCAFVHSYVMFGSVSGFLLYLAFLPP